MKQCETTFCLSIMSIALFATLSFSSAAMAADSDGDGLDDSIERMYGWNPYDANSPGEDDYDRDGLTDLTEYKAFTNIYDPNNPVTDGASDNDGDTLLKGLEVFLMGTDPDKADTDCDGVNDNLDANPVDGSCSPALSADMFDDITIYGDFLDEQVFSIGVPIDMVYTVDYQGSPSISTSDIDDDSTYMTWEVSALGNSNLAYVFLDKRTGLLTFNEGVDEDDRFKVTAFVNEYPDTSDEIIVVAGSGIPNGDSRITISNDSSDSQSFPKGEDIPLNYTVDYTYGDPISTDGNNDSATMVWSVPSEDNLTLNKDTGILVFGDDFPAETSVVVTATLKENLEITDTIEIFAKDEPKVCGVTIDNDAGTFNFSVSGDFPWVGNGVTCRDVGAGSTSPCGMYLALTESQSTGLQNHFQIYHRSIIYKGSAAVNSNMKTYWNNQDTFIEKSIDVPLADLNKAKYVCVHYHMGGGSPSHPNVANAPASCLPIEEACSIN
ncbi:hypothetical protein HQQ94_13220 [Shewanella sp. VB17]|uniref:hypothetical protein n=1 Tax=Shewanella sp. VB17 TaxID=2739432 RepID=UPI0015647E68|nr:hypothetical protein [Shewanella sp. VB17]NRD74180.1 hypothetical protein [Shewanella sp. VB17]